MSDAPLCVYCHQQPQIIDWRPFCSERCKMADLGQWLSGAYAIPSQEAADSEASRASTADQDEDEQR